MLFVSPKRGLLHFPRTLNPRTNLREKPCGDKSQSRILPTESIVIGIKREMVKIKESQPKAFGDRGMATNGIVLICNPHNQNDIEGGIGVLEEFGHDGFHA